jgi:hypothetical protein
MPAGLTGYGSLPPVGSEEATGGGRAALRLAPVCEA